ncbi:GAF domain-containing protein [Sphingomonas sp.]|uniref:GAF domain-containing protein n=1 Tax=Sphingomonas sp. TaxID=28214 RepID=UPI001B0082A9|nr:GAF domain-containing protein [Sphingomonas sp.]MBO9714277.1 GAF domain-containing protein [Sphingomonas sp.]
MNFYALAPRLKNEAQRQAAVDRYGLAKRRPERAQPLVERVAELFGTQVGVATVIDRNRQVVSAAKGMEMHAVERDISFCGHAIANPDEIMCVFDAALDPRFAGNPLVQRTPRIRFYVGLPLVTPCGQPFGALCAIDSLPRARLLPEQTHELRELGRQITATMLN